jgi:hypothetical protein
MHFCPRPSCRKAYHRDCLVKEGWTEIAKADRDIRLLCSSPEMDTDFVLCSAQPPVKRRRGAKIPPSAPAELLAVLPTNLVEIAKQPIIRGGVDGIAGNVRGVVAARKIVYSAVQSGNVPDNWEEIVDMGEPSLRAKRSPKKEAPALVCPGCQGPI